MLCCMYLLSIKKQNRLRGGTACGNDDYRSQSRPRQMENNERVRRITLNQPTNDSRIARSIGSMFYERDWQLLQEEQPGLSAAAYTSAEVQELLAYEHSASTHRSPS